MVNYINLNYLLKAYWTNRSASSFIKFKRKSHL